MDSFANFLAGVLGAIFENVLSPLLTEFFKFVVYQLIDIIKETFAWVFYYLFTTLLSVIKVMQDLFEFFAGTTKGSVTVAGQQTTVLEAIMQFDAVKQMFGVFTIIGMFLAVMFSIIATIRSMSDMTLENKNPISKVISNAIKAFVTFALIPILCLFLMQVSSILVMTIDTGSKAASTVKADSVDKLIWLTSSLDAAKNKSYNVSTASNDLVREQIMSGNDSVRKEYINGSKSYKYTDDDVADDFEYAKFSFFEGIVSCIAVILILAGCILVFIARMFEIIVLYIIGPIYAASIANDGGEMFKQWKDMFIAKFLGAYSMVFGMRLFLIIVPEICSSSLEFKTSLYTSGKEAATFHSIVQLLIVIGGAYAVYKSQTMIIRLLSVEASMQAEATAGAGTGTLMMGVGAGKAMAAAGWGAIKGKDKKDDKEKLQEKKDDDSSSGSGNAYKGGNPGGS